jgi:hypothetical protein
MSRDLELLRKRVARASAEIEPEYFLLPVADAEGGEPIVQYRERVYAYELYHQLRKHWPRRWPYSLGGEVDKRGHPLIRGENLDSVKPDLLVHVPGKMNRNLAVFEIKALRSDVQPSRQKGLFFEDVQKLIKFREIGYAAGFFLVFGDPIERVLKYGHEFRQRGLKLDLVELCHHRRAGEEATFIGW